MSYNLSRDIVFFAYHPFFLVFVLHVFYVLPRTHLVSKESTTSTCFLALIQNPDHVPGFFYPLTLSPRIS